MNPIPPGSAVTTTLLPVDGVLALVVLTTMATISAIFVMMLWSPFDVSRLDPHMVWPRNQRAATLWPNASGGTRIDVIRPSQLVGRRSIDDWKSALRRTTAA